jgi:hypothetical protein
VPQLAAIRADGDFRGGDYYDGAPPLAGMAVARQIAHTTYRSALELDTRFGRLAQGTEDPLRGGRYAVQSYLQHHGEKLGRRFDPNSYLVLTEAMNSHDIGRDRGGIAAALQRISADLTVAVVDSDRLFLPAQGALLATAPNAQGVQYNATQADLTWNAALTQAAAAHSDDMVAGNFFSHTGSNGSTAGDRVTAAGYQWRGVGENIAAGQPSVAVVVDGWMNSEGHCANLMNAAFRDIGVACVAGNANTTYRTYWTQEFGTPR